MTRGTAAQWAESTGRQCGKCSLCCKLLYVKELNKPANTWCEHCRPGKGGCSIHETRPPICRIYFCAWMMAKGLGEEWYPLRSHMVLSQVRINDVQVLMITVDPERPGVWRSEPYYSHIKVMSQRGLIGHDPMVVVIRCGGAKWLILPHEDKPIADDSYILPPQHWRRTATP